MDRVQVSALMDAEIEHDGEIDQVLKHLRTDSDARPDWETFHLIGEVMRGESAITQPGFSKRVLDALEAEPTILAPGVEQRRSSISRTLMSIAASVMGVAAVAWGAMAFIGESPQSQMAGRNSSMTFAQTAPAGFEGSRVDAAGTQAVTGMRDYLIAHQGFSVVGFSGAASPIPVQVIPAGYGR